MPLPRLCEVDSYATGNAGGEINCLLCVMAGFSESARKFDYLTHSGGGGGEAFGLTIVFTLKTVLTL